MRFRLFGRVYTLSKKIYVLIIIVMLASVAVIGRFWLQKSRNVELSLVPTVSPAPTRIQNETILPKETPTPSPNIPVYVSGEVHCPGVYWVSTGTIVAEVVELAGGLTSQANVQVVNLALRVEDGMHLHIPNQNSSETDWILSASSPAAKPTPGKVNINTADLDGLMTLPGVGESTAKDILRYRQNNGFFHTIEDLMQVPGIKQARFDKIKDMITV